MSGKLLRRPRLIKRIRDWIDDLDTAYLTTNNSTALERSLALALGIPLNGLDPELLYWGTKSGSREAFAAAGVAHPAGTKGVRDESGIVEALDRLAQQQRGISRAVIKFDAGSSGDGNAVYTFPAPLPEHGLARHEALSCALASLGFAAPGETRERYLRKFEQMGGVVEDSGYSAKSRNSMPIRSAISSVLCKSA